MTPDLRDRFMLRLQAAWPKPIADATAIVWSEHLSKMDGDIAMTALGVLERTSPRQPALSEFHEAYSAARAGKPSTVLLPSACVVCEDGWVEVACADRNCTRPHHTVTRCPNGCLPPTREEREARRLAEDREWFAEREKRVSSVASLIENAAPGAEYPSLVETPRTK